KAVCTPLVPFGTIRRATALENSILFSYLDNFATSSTRHHPPHPSWSCANCVPNGYLQPSPESRNPDRIYRRPGQAPRHRRGSSENYRGRLSAVHAAPARRWSRGNSHGTSSTNGAWRERSSAGALDDRGAAKPGGTRRYQ